MARGEKSGNREAKKPKQDKPKAAPPVSPFAAQGSKATTSAGAPKGSASKR
jgi:hypothetical protein